ncbi:hypothetical protein GCM10011359_19300 [Nesterenkonia alkaliphila]|nr:hypothetical protein GCM10011359_19300 [Nesterenkonia alkaliphila]
MIAVAAVTAVAHMASVTIVILVPSALMVLVATVRPVVVPVARVWLRHGCLLSAGRPGPVC